MSERMLNDDEISRMATPLWEQARTAYHDGRADDGDRLLDAATTQWAALKDYSINWITSLLTFVGEELGEEAVERALRKTGEEFVRPRRNTGTVEVDEDDEKIVLSFRCGTGGKLVDDGRYEGEHAYLTLRERSGRTFMRDELPVYCAHCSVNNEIQPVEWGGAPTSIEHPPTRKGEQCVHHIYKDVRAIPDEAYRRIGKTRPSR